MNTNTKQTENLAESGNCLKPLLQDSADFNTLSFFDGMSNGQIAL